MLLKQPRIWVYPGGLFTGGSEDQEAYTLQITIQPEG